MVLGYRYCPYCHIVCRSGNSVDCVIMDSINDFSEQLARYEQERYERLAEIHRNEEQGICDETVSTPTEEEAIRCPRCQSAQLKKPVFSHRTMPTLHFD